MEKARAMVRASEQANTLYKVSQNRRYDPHITAYRNLVVDNLGSLGILNADFFIGAHIGGWREEMASPLIFDMAIHTFDAARYICQRDAVSVYCEEFNPPWSWFAGDASANALFEMEDGLRYTYRGSWVSNGRHTTWEADWRAVGERGSATWDVNNALIAEVVTSVDSYLATTERIEAAPIAMPHRGLAASLRDFLHALETGETPESECHDNIKSLAMVFAAMESSRTGQRVKVETGL
jgi:predicted dehydrogenase